MYLRKRALRFSLVFLFLIVCLFLFSVQLVLIQVFRSSHLADLAQQQQNHYVKLEPVRGTVFDRRMRPLAINLSVQSLYANPRQMSSQDKLLAVKKLSDMLGLNSSYLENQLGRKKYFVWLVRKLPMDLAEQIKKLDLKGLGFIKESKRYYPNQNLAAHLIGFAGVDNLGLEGLELAYDKDLRGEFGWMMILRDARQQELMLDKGFIPPKDGFSLVLTIDETIQYIAERALEKAFKKHHAKSASIIVMDPRTGEILALANLPTYNLESYNESRTEARTNRAVSYIYEPGSVFKIVPLTAALEEQAVQETDKFFCENGEYRVANHILHDHHSHGWLTFSEVIEQSSNIGTVKVAQKIGLETVYKYAKRFHFGETTGIDVQGEVPGILKPPSKWSKTSIGAIPIGQEVAVTPLQLVSAISAIANDGVYMRPFVVKYIKDSHDELIKGTDPKAVDQVMSADTARRVKAILQKVVEQGTGKLAQIKGVNVAGKTGTAQKPEGGGYSQSKFYATFFGFAPVENPRLAAVVVFDEPHPNHFGGTVSAPVFREVISDSLRYLNALDAGM